MARKLNQTTPADDGPTKGHNVADRTKVMSECAHRMREIQKQRQSLNEDAGGVRERLKDNGIDVKSFMAALRLADMEDTSARDTYIDGLREAMEVLGVGTQLDMFGEHKAADDAEDDDLRPSFLRDQDAAA